MDVSFKLTMKQQIDIDQVVITPDKSEITEVRKLRSRSIDLETDIDGQLKTKMADERQHQEIHNQKDLPLIKSFDLSYDHPLVVQDIWPIDLWPEKPLEARHDFMISDSEEESNFVCIQLGILQYNFESN